MVYYNKKFGFYVIIIVVGIICYANTFEIIENSCCGYNGRATLQCCTSSNNTKDCCKGCADMNNPSALSYNCTFFNISQPSPKEVVYPIGQSINFTIVAYERECILAFKFECTKVCAFTYKPCNVKSTCCNAYSGEDPGFKVNIWAPNGEGPKYSQYLNCTFPTWIPNKDGIYNFTCILTGWGLASALKPLQLQLTSLAWLRLSNTLPPRSIDLRYIAGDLSVQDCIWQWEISNSFSLKEYGTMKITLNDAYGNRIWGLTGGREIETSDFNISFQRYGSGTALSPEKSPIFAKLSSRMAFGLCIVSIYSTQVGSYTITIADAQGNKLKDMPTVFYVLPDGLAKDLFISQKQVLINTKTYFSGDVYVNDFFISGSLSISFKIKRIHWLSLCIIIFRWMDVLDA